MRLYKNTYFQGTLSDDTSEKLLALRELPVVSSLKHSIYNLPDTTVTEIKNCKLESISALHYEKPMGTLEDMQTIGTAFMYYTKACLLGDEVGLGKTVQVAALINILKAEYKKNNKVFRYIFLTESAPVSEIRDKLVKFTGDYVYLMSDGTQGKVAKMLQALASKQINAIAGTHAVLNNAAFIAQCAKEPFDLIVVDESSVLRNVGKTTQMYSNAKAILSKHLRVILLNATPLETKVRDLYNQLNLLEKGYLPTITDFERDFCVKSLVGAKYEVIGLKNSEVLKKALELKYLARTRKMQNAVYENNIDICYVVDASAEQKDLFRRAALPRQICDCPTEVDMNIPFDVYTTPKAGTVLYIMANRVKPKERVFLFCHYLICQQRLAELLEKAGYHCAIINRTVKAAERVKIQKEFSEGAYDILISNIARGLDFDYCEHCILYTIATNPSKLTQVEGRLERTLDIRNKNLHMIFIDKKETGKPLETLRKRINMSESVLGEGRNMLMSAIKESSTIIRLTKKDIENLMETKYKNI